MKKHYLLTFLLFLLFIEFPLLSTLYAQEKEQQPALQNRLAVSLLKWLDPVNPGIDLTWERMTDSRRSVQFNLGLMRDPIHITPFEQYRGFAGGIERKWYKAEKKKNIHPKSHLLRIERVDSRAHEHVGQHEILQATDLCVRFMFEYS